MIKHRIWFRNMHYRNKNMHLIWKLGKKVCIMCATCWELWKNYLWSVFKMFSFLRTLLINEERVGGIFKDNASYNFPSSSRKCIKIKIVRGFKNKNSNRKKKLDFCLVTDCVSLKSISLQCSWVIANTISESYIQ